MNLQSIIENAWVNEVSSYDALTINTINEVIALLDGGVLRVAEKKDNKWSVNEWVKKAILLYFKITKSKVIDLNEVKYFDKVPLKYSSWTQERFEASGVRVVPASAVRFGAHVGPKCIIMPSFVNIGAFIDESSMIDTWATVGSCAQIGKRCHISGGAGIGGVLEPLQANPVIIEDDVFVGARSEIAEGVIIEKGSVISMGVYIGASTRIYDRANDEVFYGRVPPYSVVVSGTLPSSDGKTQTYAAIIVKKVDEQTRSKTSINELLRAA